MAKYYSSEMSMRVSNGSMAVLGGSGYMKDYPVERYLRDSRITTIYEGTSQLQVIAAVAGTISGTCKDVIDEIIAKPTRADAWPTEVQPLLAQIQLGLTTLYDAVEFVKAQAGGYRDLYARKLVDIGVYLLVGALFCDQAASPFNGVPKERQADGQAASACNPKKLAVAKRWLTEKLPVIAMLAQQAKSGDMAILNDFDTLAGPVPVTE
jgi:alkylation response protein AidB-like acyl-CoA dehydrogenase